MNTFAKELKRYLRLADMSQKDLSDRLGYSKSAVSLWLKGTSLPKPTTIFQIENVLHLPPNTLMQIAYGEFTEPDITEADPTYQPSTAIEDFADIPATTDVTVNLSNEFSALYDKLNAARHNPIKIGNVILTADQIEELINALRKIVFGF